MVLLAIEKNYEIEAKQDIKVAERLVYDTEYGEGQVLSAGNGSFVTLETLRS